MSKTSRAKWLDEVVAIAQRTHAHLTARSQPDSSGIATNSEEKRVDAVLMPYNRPQSLSLYYSVKDGVNGTKALIESIDMQRRYDLQSNKDY